ncbi:MAG: molybdopterin converting factor subunit 1 [Janthinobacterium lividum]
MHIKLRLFASLRETLGVSSDNLTLPDSTRTAGDVLHTLRARGGTWAEALSDPSAFRIAVDQAIGSLDSLVHDGAELAFFPPVTGG